PVANGSSVPACPARARVRSRRRLTIANDDCPAGLSTRTSPVGLSARGGTGPGELPADELNELLDRLVAREAGRLRVPTASTLARDRRDVELVARGAQADPPRRVRRLGRLPNRRRHLGAVDRAQVV